MTVILIIIIISVILVTVTHIELFPILIQNNNLKLFSQAESAVEGQEERARAPDLPVIVQKSNREDVTERFGKFEIKAELESKDHFILYSRR